MANKRYTTSYAAKAAGKGRFADSLTYKGFNLYLIPIAFLFSIFPLIVRLYLYDSGLNDQVFYYSEGRATDFFLYYKAVAFILLSTVMAVVLVLRLFSEGKKIRFDKIFIPLGAYALLSMISAVASEHSTFCFEGIYEQFESVWVLIGYAVTAYYTYLVVREVSDVKTLFWFMFAGAVLVTVVGLTQYFSRDFLKTDAAYYLMIPKQIRLTGRRPEFIFDDGIVFSTLYNPNYVGTYVALFFPIFLMVGFSKEDDKRYLIRSGLCFILLAGLVMILIGSGSLTGTIGVIGAFIMFLIISCRYLFRRPWIGVTAVVLFAAAVIGFNAYTNGAYLDKLMSAIGAQPREYDIERMVTTDEDVTITYKGETVHLRYTSDLEQGTVNFEIGDDDDNLYAYDYTVDGSVLYNIVEGPLSGAVVCIPALLSQSETHPVYGMSVTFDGRTWYFTNETDGTYYQCTYPDKFSKLVDVEKVEWLDARGGMASGRGYIWSRTLPLLKHNLFIGSGPDTFVFEYPNGDFVGIRNNGFDGMVVTKPHNMYMQTGVQTGCLSLVLLLAFYVIYLIRSFSVYFKIKKHNFISRVGVGILCGSFGYMIAGIANDSTVCITPIFWVLMGMGLAINEMVKRQQIEL